MIAKDLIKVNECAEMLRLTVPTIYGWVHEKKIPYIKLGSLLYFDRSRILQWVEEQTVEPTKKFTSRTKFQEVRDRVRSLKTEGLGSIRAG